jgi:ubiquinone/menaquinone biosynthesis C-methylase UbiE
VTSGDEAAGVHPSAAVGFQQAAEAYRRGRPDYPDDALAFLGEVLDVRSGRRVLDLAAGTGKLTRLLVPTGAAVVAVEPVEAMRSALAADLPEVEALEGRAEDLPLDDASFDAAVVAQAFHWFDGPAALRELHRVLRPGSALALVWNVRDDERSAFWSRLTEMLAPYRGDTPSHEGRAWRAAFDATELFTPLETRSFPYRHETTREAAVDRVLSISFVAMLPEGEREWMRAQVFRMLDEDPEIGPAADRFTLPYRTDVHWCHRP